MNSIKVIFFLYDFFLSLFNSFTGVISYLTEVHTMPNGSEWSYIELMFTVGLPFFLLWTFLTWLANIVT